MFEREYRREMDQVKLSQVELDRLVNAMAEEKRRHKRGNLGVRVLLTAAAVFLLTASALALSPTLRSQLTQVLGNFGPYSQRIEAGTAADQGYEVQVLSAVTDQYRLKLYVQVRDLTGRRMTDGEIRLVCRIGRDTQTLTTHGRCVGYDPDSHTALFEVSEFWEEASGLEEELTLEVISMWPRYYSFGGEPLPLEEVTGRTLDCMTLENGQVVVAPGQTPAPLEDFEWAELSSMGFAEDGTFQVLFRLAEGADPEESDILADILVDGEPPCRHLGDINYTLDGRTYVGVSYENISPADLGHFTRATAGGDVVMGRKTKGDWALSFRVDNLPVREYALSGLTDQYQLPCKLTLTPLGAMLTGDYEAGWRGMHPFSLILEDGSRLEEVYIRHGRMTPGKESVLGNWDFGQFLDLDQAVGLELGSWYISLSGEDTGTVYPLEGREAWEQGMMAP